MNFKKLTNSLKKFDIVKNTKKYIIAAVSFMLIGLIVVLAFGFNLGIDFTGGTVIKINIGSDLEQTEVYQDYTNQIENILKSNNLSLSLKQKEGVNDDASIMIRFQDIKGYSEEEMQVVIDTVKAEIVTALSLDETQVEESQRIGPSATAALVLNALLAVLFATILILIYIGFRFELLSGLTAILALVHDVLIMLAFVAIFRLQINSAFVAALITIIGYSINNTIVIFDRIRENKQKESYKEKSNADIVNISIRETFTRTVNTSITTITVIVALIFFSVPSIREFILPIVVGIVAGTFSSIFVAPPLWAIVNDKTRPRNKNAKILKDKKPNTETKEQLQV